MSSPQGRTRSTSRHRRTNVIDSTPPEGAVFEGVNVDERFNQRLNVLDELLNTERDYMSDLKTIVDFYKRNLEAGKKELYRYDWTVLHNTTRKKILYPSIGNMKFY
jgi:hypothetical protein